MQSIPTKDQAKAKYGISNDDFEIFTSNTVPAPDAETTVDPVDNWFGLRAFLRKSRAGRILVLILVIGYGVIAGPALVKEKTDKAHDGAVAWAHYVEPFAHLPKQPTRLPLSFPLKDHVMSPNAAVNVANISYIATGTGNGTIPVLDVIGLI